MIVLPTDAASQKAMVGLVQRVVLARARAPHDAVVRHYLEYLGVSIRGVSSREALGRLYSSREYFRKLHHALRMHRLTSRDRSGLWLKFPEVYELVRLVEHRTSHL